MVINVLDHVNACDTGDQGEVIRKIIEPILLSGQAVDLSFSGLSTATSSFVNTAFVDMLDKIPASKMKHLLRIIDSTRQINQLIIQRIRSESGALT